jgi:hypothetical protein
MKTNIVQGTFKPRRWWRSKWFLLGVVIVLLITAGIMMAVHVRDNRREAKAAKVELQILQAQVTEAVFKTQDNTGAIEYTTTIINGAKSGHFKISPSDLGQFYLDRAAAYNNLGNLKAALADYKTAVAIDSSTKIAALQAELSIQSRQGNKSALVPLLQQLVPLFQNSSMPLAAGQAAQYQNDITAIQSGQEVSF